MFHYFLLSKEIVSQPLLLVLTTHLLDLGSDLFTYLLIHSRLLFHLLGRHFWIHLREVDVSCSGYVPLRNARLLIFALVAYLFQLLVIEGVFIDNVETHTIGLCTGY